MLAFEADKRATVSEVRDHAFWKQLSISWAMVPADGHLAKQ